MYETYCYEIQCCCGEYVQYIQFVDPLSFIAYIVNAMEVGFAASNAQFAVLAQHARGSYRGNYYCLTNYLHLVN